MMTSITMVPAWGMPGGSEILLILLIAVILFGHKRIPQLGEALGKGIRNFKNAFSKEETNAAEPAVKAQSSESSKTGNDSSESGEE